ncbi:hypothetical protein GGX14DRAFT_570039 [Mycena pura]|uniref:CMP/dCMP-type deaminase domain-containing protein n=1 Tax=Mycena pura TaxID=153505 RepID=A0AAD6V646_9AGAR|nr:hypothetical protein GGX14DRAFT_570039 [Mycena pura]
MNKTQFYLSQCAEAASKSPMYYTLGSAIVKGGKVISTGCNHQRPNYDAPGGGRPVSMHAEMASIFNATRGRAPAPKLQQRKQKNQIGQVPHEAAEGSNLEWRQRTKRVSYDETAQRAFYPSRYPHRPHYQAEEDPAYGYAYEHGHGSGARDMGRKQPWRARLNGADLYVCRVTKSGAFGCSKPCWRCVEWCAWAGIKRIFHWSVVEGRFICLKVSDAHVGDCYETVTERILATPS